MPTENPFGTTILFYDQAQRGVNATKRIEYPVLGEELAAPAERRIDAVTGEPLILRVKRAEDRGDWL